LVERIVDNKGVIDFMLNSWPDKSKIDRDHLGQFGFSRGYTPTPSYAIPSIGFAEAQLKLSERSTREDRELKKYI
jgi:hypothetical protein